MSGEAGLLPEGALELDWRLGGDCDFVVLSRA